MGYLIILVIILIILAIPFGLLGTTAAIISWIIIISLVAAIIYISYNNKQKLKDAYNYCITYIPKENIDFETYIQSLDGKKIELEKSEKSSLKKEIEFSSYSVWINYILFKSVRYDKIDDISVCIEKKEKQLRIIVNFIDSDYNERTDEISYFHSSTYIDFSIKQLEYGKYFFTVMKNLSVYTKQKKENEEKQKLINRQNSINKFYKDLDNIATFQIDINTEKSKVNQLENMPETKIVRLTKAFNKDTLYHYIVIHIETTGLYPHEGSEIIELAGIKFIDGKPYEKFNTLITPKNLISEEITEINGITNEMVKNSPYLEEIRNSFISFLGKCDLVGYNLPFILKFLYVYGFNEVFTEKRKFFDVYSYVKRLYEDNDYLEDLKLKSVSEYLGIYRTDERALSDCYATAKIFQGIIQDL